MAEKFHTLLLLALPASGKSEVRKFLTNTTPDLFHMGPTIQLDDYPYVHLQIRVDEEVEKLGFSRLYHDEDGGPFRAGTDWGALIRLLNEDYAEVLSGKAENPPFAARRLFQRFDDASERAGGPRRIAELPAEVQSIVEAKLEDEARAHFAEKAAQIPASLDGHTIVIEFARGGPEGASKPLPLNYGYAGSLRHMDRQILEQAAVLYIWVSPEESRRKNRERARPDGAGSILFHGTPERVMFEEYGTDDMEYLLNTSPKPDTIQIDAEGGSILIPTVRFDNREDLTTFVRGDANGWAKADVDKLYGGIRDACDRLWTAYVSLKRNEP